MNVSIRDLKNGLSRILKHVRSGHEVIVTDRGKPIARLNVFDARKSETIDQTVQRLRRLPWIRPAAGGKPKGAANPLPQRRGAPLMSDLVREGRE
jgi:prevent-host-death family protein